MKNKKTEEKLKPLTVYFPVGFHKLETKYYYFSLQVRHQPTELSSLQTLLREQRLGNHITLQFYIYISPSPLGQSPEAQPQEQLCA